MPTYPHLLSLSRANKADQFASRPPCPYCQHTHVHAVGFRNGIQHFRCTNCKKSYSQRTGTSRWWLHKRTTFAQYEHHLLTHGHAPLRSLKKKFNISLLTAFDWRHKILASLNLTPTQFKGFIELRNTEIPFSRKGMKQKADMPSAPVQLLITADYSNNAGFDMARIGKLQHADFDKHVGCRIDADHVIISPYSKGLSEIAKRRRYAMTLFSKKHNPNELSDIKTHALHNKLHNLIFNRTHGVSTKYLMHYSRWIAHFELALRNSPPNPYAWFHYTGIEENYQQFFNDFADIRFLRTSKRVWVSKLKTKTITNEIPTQQC